MLGNETKNCVKYYIEMEDFKSYLFLVNSCYRRYYKALNVHLSVLQADFAWKPEFPYDCIYRIRQIPLGELQIILKLAFWLGNILGHLLQCCQYMVRRLFPHVMTLVERSLNVLQAGMRLPRY